MKKLLINTCVFIIILLPMSAWAQLLQTVEISSSPNPVGSGARALGMGGAFIGVADDATAASWNPAGLIQLETPEISGVYSHNERKEDTTFRAFPEASGPQEVSTNELNYLSLAYPFTARGNNMIISLNYQHLLDFNKNVQYSYLLNEPGPPTLVLNNSIDYEQEGAFRTITPAFAVQLTPQVSFGLSLNFWNQKLYENKWTSRYRSQGQGFFSGFPVKVDVDVMDSYTLEGASIDLLDPMHWSNINFVVGMLWKANEKLTVGMVFKSPFDAELNHTKHFAAEISFPTAPASDSQSVTSLSETVTIEMPMSYGFGLAWRQNDTLTFALDCYRTEWDDYTLVDGEGNRMNPITGKPSDESNITPTTQVRFGVEYVFLRQDYLIPLRGGLLYDPEPAESSPDDFFGFSLGSGFGYKQYVFDLAYQYRFGRNVRSITMGDEDSVQDVDQHTIYASFIYLF